jgi:hypothetical protein
LRVQGCERKSSHSGTLILIYRLGYRIKEGRLKRVKTKIEVIESFVF